MNPLDSIPFLGGYNAQTNLNQQRGMGQLQQVQGLMGLLQAVQQQQLAQRKLAQEEKYRSGLRPDMTPEERAAHAAQFAGPEALITDAQRRTTAANTLQLGLARVAENARAADSLIAHRISQEKDSRLRLQLEEQRLRQQAWYNEQSLRQGGEKIFYDTGTRINIPAPPTNAVAPPVEGPMPYVDAMRQFGGRPIGSQPFTVETTGQQPIMGQASAPQAASYPQVPMDRPPSPIQPQPSNLDARDLRLQGSPAAPSAPTMPQFAGSPREQAQSKNKWLLEQAKAQAKGASGGAASDETVNAIIEGRMPMPTGFALRSPYWQDVIERVAKKDPNFDASRYGARAAARRTFASGPEARNVTALNTVIGHLGTLDEMAQALANQDVRVVNVVVNRLRSELGDERVQNFDTAKTAVASETMRVFRQVGASTQEIQDWEKRITSSGSPEQLRGVIATLGKLLESRIDAINAQYERSLSTQSPARVDPANRQVLDRLIQQGGGGGAWNDVKEQRYQELLRKRGGS